ncbi:pentapeptide repeat-containing protein [Micromonospora sp. DT4]|uniref:pentapeptide repeat-containing protein n=1 Tax=Micromonospora sp. DT4 TaxID=3393438 RepID=UPI003CE7BF00
MVAGARPLTSTLSDLLPLIRGVEFVGPTSRIARTPTSSGRSHLRHRARRTDLRRTDLRRTDLRRTDLRRTDLCRTDLCLTDLYRTDLRRTDLRGTADPRRGAPGPGA